MTQLAPHQQRVVDEKRELDERREKLGAFKNTDLFESLPWQEQERLNTQAHIMTIYSAVLGERIAAIGVPGAVAALPVIDQGPGVPRTLAEALDVIRAMHWAVVELRCPEVMEMVRDENSGEFDALVRSILCRSAPVARMTK